MSLRARLPVVVGATVAALVLGGPATAYEPEYQTDYALPFACGETWTGTTRHSHSPHVDAVDFNRDRDLGAFLVASAPGVVSRVEDAGNRSYGKWLVIDHGEGRSTLYAHLKAQWVGVGQAVDEGATIGLVGNTGGVTGAHLHYEQKLDRDVQPAVFDGAPFVYGSTVTSSNCPDVPVAGDWDGDQQDELAVFRRGVRTGTFVLATDPEAPTEVGFGRSTDVPLTGDWDGDGTTDVGVRRQRGRVFLLRHGDGTKTRTRIGSRKDVPLTGDWDGDGRTDLGLYRAARSRFILLNADGTRSGLRLGAPGAVPVTGDWDGDGVTDLGVFSAGTFTLRTVVDGQPLLRPVPFGVTADLPVTGDWNGDGVTDVGAWTPSTATWSLRSAWTNARGRARARVTTVVFGNPR